MICKWWPNAQATQMVVQATVNTVAVGGQLIATINGATVSYTCVTGDTTTTAATNWYQLLAASTTPPEFQEETWTNPGNGNVRATAKEAGTPFAGITGGLVFSATGGCAVTQTTVTANSSPSDAANPKNWLRNNLNTLPQNNDDLVVADASVGILWNLDTAFPNVALATYTRYQSFTGTVGLNEVNPNGYQEYRATYLKMKGGGSSGSSSSPSGGGSGNVFNVVLGFGGGSGPQRERYDFQSQQINVAALASGQPLDAYAVRILGSNAANVVTVVNTSVGVAMIPAETATLASATVSAGGSISLGPAVTFTGTLTVNGGAAAVNCLVNSLLAQDGAQIFQGTVAGNLRIDYPLWTLKNGSSATWLSGSNIASLILQTRSTFDKSRDLRPMNLNALSIEVDTCLLSDPNNVITFAGPVQMVNALQSGPFRFAPGRTLQIS